MSRHECERGCWLGVEVSGETQERVSMPTLMTKGINFKLPAERSQGDIGVREFVSRSFVQKFDISPFVRYQN